MIMMPRAISHIKEGENCLKRGEKYFHVKKSASFNLPTFSKNTYSVLKGGKICEKKESFAKNLTLFTFQNGKNGMKKDLLSLLSQKNTKEELEFLRGLISFMERRKTPIERPPMLGFKQSEF